MIWSFNQIWWLANLNSGRFIYIYGWGLRHNLAQLSSIIAGDVTPFYQSVLAWIYVILSALVIIFSLFLKGIKGIIIMFIAGAGYLSYALVAVYVVITNRLADFNLPLEGSTMLREQLAVVSVKTSLQNGFYVACACGVIIVFLALLRPVIVDGNNAPITQ
jgi:hypothetical protein